jgi:hypothetical protein
MPIDKNSNTYKEGQEAFHEGLLISDKPVHFVLQEWEAGWHDAHVELTRRIAAKLAVD